MQKYANMCSLAVLLLTAANTSASGPKADLSAFDQTRLTIQTQDGNRHVDVFVAKTSEQHRRGLMYVKELPEKQGMLFIHDYDAIRSMWMRNTYIPLDMLFISADGEVRNIAADTVPFSLDAVRSDGPVRAVLELNAGTAKKLGINAGDRVIHEFFELQPTDPPQGSDSS